MKGTGKWTVQQAVELSVAIPTIAASLDSRFLSGLKEERVEAAKVFASGGIHNAAQIESNMGAGVSERAASKEAELLGFDNYISPYATASGEDILRGVNYASAAAGIREETGRQLGGRISFSGQVNNYKNTVSQMVNMLGDQDTAVRYLSKCIFSIGLGNNDYLNNYFMPIYYSTGSQYTPDQYADVLLKQYSQQIEIMYKYGARKFVLIGVGQIGCSPNELANNSPDGQKCVSRINAANQIFNSKLKSLVDRFNSQLADAHFIYINAYGIFQDMLNDPAAYGFSVTNAGCCGVGRNNAQITCLPMQLPCPDRNDYLFWDAYHPSEAANIIVGSRSYHAQSSSDAHPYDIEHLARV
ncbi:hypothetical protein Droror1_Dr00012022 [Drosera rotundifolia]